ncbi:hypothetical protein PQE20_17730 [Vibrio harveyi]|uniref:hypothetical protein n=1 Tax=Vibrio harveyi TaxID=669 RepID=UPI00234DA2CB|nr:hypothetical protein [Vibrio harveyi]WCP83259.1 hypothetical protein PQE20_17730 [Vibrio harveyi]
MSDFDLDDMLDLFDDENEGAVQPSDISRHSTETSLNIDVYVMEDMKKGLRYNRVSQESIALLRRTPEYKKTGSVTRAFMLIIEEALLNGFEFNYNPKYNVKCSSNLAYLTISEVVENNVTDKLKSGDLEPLAINFYYDQFIKAKLGGIVQEPAKKELTNEVMLYRVFTLLLGATGKTTIDLCAELNLKTTQIGRLKKGKVGLNAMNSIATALNSYDEQIRIDIFNKLVTIKLPNTEHGRVLDYEEFSKFSPSKIRYI